ncbi:Ig-like domain-containing protein [Marinobacter sp. ATCH36]|uniref:Ig-like domain-containing protein n=1 Tax=Marinobacter sp. ATCH36 TaxID=2945106 RepID=UPI002022241E|nr:Ig-like domain-containing protein [Marinobacter sp. ATCH36]MCL7945923.1 Ig-like domain-containing protein [Marinobacter sp. ATCH36]
MSGKILARASAVSLALILAACGGDDSSSSLAGTGDQQNGSGDSNNDGGSNAGGGVDTDGDGETDLVIGSLKISASPVQMGTSNSSTSEILVFARNSNNVLAENIPVTFSVDADATLQVLRGTTDATGTAEAVLSTPQNPKNRPATVTATAGGIESTITINITGTSLSLDGPTNISVGNTATFTANLMDSDGNGVPLESVSIESSIQNPSTLYTNDQGQGSFELQPTSAGTYPVEVTAFSGESELSAVIEINVSDSDFAFTDPAPGDEIDIGSPANVTFAWTEGSTGQSGEPISFSITRGMINGSLSFQDTTDGNGEITTTVSSNSAGPATIVARNDGSGLSTSMDIEFVAINPESIVTQASQTQLKPGEQSRITAIVRDANNNLVKGQRVLFNIPEDVSNGDLSSPSGITDSLGRVSTVFTAGSSGTGSEGTLITATLESDNSIQDATTLTVSDGALRLTIGTGNTLEEEGSPAYLKEWIVYVSDANGQPIENADVELKVLPSSYSKGTWQPGICGSGTEPNCWIADVTATCPAEDINYNGNLDTGEDVNLSDSLEPTNDAVAVATSDASAEDGSFNFALKYPQSACRWTEVLVEAKVNVGGTEITESAKTTLSCLASDLTDLDVTPPNIDGGSRYGKSASCFDAD